VKCVIVCRLSLEGPNLWYTFDVGRCARYENQHFPAEICRPFCSKMGTELHQIFTEHRASSTHSGDFFRYHIRCFVSGLKCQN